MNRTKEKIKKNSKIERNCIIKENKKIKNRGITLISLVVTIIVLLILAGISITMLQGKNGLISKAKESVSLNVYGQAEEQSKLEQANLITQKNTNHNLGIEDLANDAFNDLKIDESSTEGFKDVSYNENDNTIYLTYINKKLKKGLKSLQDGKVIFKIKIDENNVYFDGEISEEDYTKISVVSKTGEQKKLESLKVGDVINYTPTSGKYDALAKYTGYTNDQNLDSSNDDYKITQWYIYEISEDGVLTLISKNVTSGQLYFYGAQGYNNAVKVLNDACEKLYSDSSLEIEARSMNMTDLEKHFTDLAINKYRGEYSISVTSNDAQYGTRWTDGYTNDDKTYRNDKGAFIRSTKYPIIYAMEKDSQINENTINSSGLSISEQNSYIESTGVDGAIDGYISPNSIHPMETYWNMSKQVLSKAYKNSSTSSQMNYANMIHNADYWLASRSVQVMKDCAVFKIDRVLSDALGGSNAVYYSNNYKETRNSALRPIISVKASKLNLIRSSENAVTEVMGGTGDSVSYNVWSIN